jgi:hypothetical protein
MVTYWVCQSPSQGNFPKKTLSRPCNEYEVDWGSPLKFLCEIKISGLSEVLNWFGSLTN